ncbi:NUDIX hydrolase [Streptomyces sp. NPDC090085]|uniref:NUDIX hydrolase n=1 Tax=Streptomyces sp. NPDC090085 TaxID=3365943 RepID=UPI00380189F9
MPGGHVVAGEAPHVAAARELAEETGLARRYGRGGPRSVWPRSRSSGSTGGMPGCPNARTQPDRMVGIRMRRFTRKVRRREAGRGDCPYMRLPSAGRG